MIEHSLHLPARSKQAIFNQADRRKPSPPMSARNHPDPIPPRRKSWSKSDYTPRFNGLFDADPLVLEADDDIHA